MPQKTAPNSRNAAIRERLALLRAALRQAGVDGFIIPHADEHQSEYLPAAAERLAWLTGFTGSAGTAIVLADRAAIFVDGRYTLQVRQQTDVRAFAPESLLENGPVKWLSANLKGGERIGYDPWLITLEGEKRLKKAVAGAGAELVALDANPIDPLWADRPAAPSGQVVIHPPRFAGESAEKKLKRMAAELRQRKLGAAVLSDPTSIAWAFNLRGSDIAHVPVGLAFSIIRAEGKPSLFIDGRKLSNLVRARLAGLADINEPSALAAALADAGRAASPVLVDASATAAAIAAIIEAAGGVIVEGDDPVSLPRAIKNPVEIEGTRRAHLRDGVAMVRFLAWLDGVDDRGDLDEIEVSDRLAEFRRDTAEADGMELVDLSFASISGAGPNGAIVHYHATPETARKLAPRTLYLIDVGSSRVDLQACKLEYSIVSPK